MRVMPKVTAVPHPADKGPPQPMGGGKGVKRAVPGDEPTEPAPATPSTPMSMPSEEQSSTSNKRYRKPRTIREFAAQANEIATLVLNGEIDLETARNYASLARVVSQTASIEVTRARFLKREPDLSLE